MVLLDARHIGQGASGRNSGYAVGLSHFSGGFDPSQSEEYRRVNRINRAGLDILRGQVNDHAIECQWRESGIYHTARDKHAEAEGESFLRYLDALKEPHRALDADELRPLFLHP